MDGTAAWGSSISIVSLHPRAISRKYGPSLCAWGAYFRTPLCLQRGSFPIAEAIPSPSHCVSAFIESLVHKQRISPSYMDSSLLLNLLSSSLPLECGLIPRPLAQEKPDLWRGWLDSMGWTGHYILFLSPAFRASFWGILILRAREGYMTKNNIYSLAIVFHPRGGRERIRVQREGVSW